MPYNIKSQEVSGVAPKRFREGGKLHHWVRMYLEASGGDSLERIKSVQYELHPTFRERIRFANEAANQFEIRIWTYGYFTAKATLVMNDGTNQEIQDFIKW